MPPYANVAWNWSAQSMRLGPRPKCDCPIQPWTTTAWCVWEGNTRWIGLLLRTLHDLGGSVAFAPAWDSAGTPAGDYRVVVVLRNADGAVLDQDEIGFRLGAVQGEVTALTVSPDTFAAGPHFDLTLVFSNTGSVPITGTAVIAVYAVDAIEATAVMTATLGNVQPGAAATFPTTWDAAGAPTQDYRIQGQVKYDGRATPLVVVDLIASNKVYLPLVLRE